MNTAGKLMMPPSKGPAMNAVGTCMPCIISNLFRYWLQDMETMAAPTAYSSTRSHPMIHAQMRPMVAKLYV